MKLLLYCTKAKPYLVKDAYLVKDGGKYFIGSSSCLRKWSLNGKIVAECDYVIEKITCRKIGGEWESYGEYTDFIELSKKSMLTQQELCNYLSKNAGGYAIHIKNLHIFDELKDFSEYSKNVEHCKCDECLENCKKYCKYYYAKNNITQTINTGCTKYALLYKAPQNMMYVFDLEEKKVLISIRPEWLCKILNGEKTIEVRKKVLKEMI